MSMASLALLASQLPSPRETQTRLRCNNPPELWRDRLASIPFDQEKLEWYDREVKTLKSKVETMLLHTYTDAVERIKFIDLLSRLGISYYFEAEIERQLHQIFDSQLDLSEKRDHDLYTAAIIFRVFRQHGIVMSSDIFNKFKDSETQKFKNSLTSDPKGLLSLFEAAHVLTHGEDILEEALTFTRTHLEKLAQSKSDFEDEINSSLSTPLHKGPVRLKAREFISFYEKRHQEDDYEPKNDTLLKFAKFDFNRVQLLHQQEIKDIYRWSKDQELASKLPLGRDILMEFFFWADSIHSDPNYAYARAEYTKQGHLISFLDDIYDTYGDFVDLPILTDAMNRWDRDMIDRLPKDYMRHLYKIYLDTFDELENHVAEDDGLSIVVSLTREYLQEFARVYMMEAEWVKSGYLPSFKESLDLGILSAGNPYMQAVAFLGIGGELTIEACKWLKKGPRMAEAACVISRLANDLVSHKREEESTGNLTGTFSSYKREYNTSDEETEAEFQRKILNAWKTMNEELIKESEKIPLEILMRVFNYGRIMEICYKVGDGMTDGTYTERLMKTMYFDPIPL